MSYLKQDHPTHPVDVIGETDLLLPALDPDGQIWVDRLLHHLRQLHRRSEYFWAGLRRQLQQLARRRTPPPLLRRWGRPALWAASALLAAQLAVPAALAQDPLGSEFRVNTYTTNYQYSPSIAIDAGGNFVVAWHGHGQGGDSYDIYAQRYGSDGSTQGSEFRVNTYTTNRQENPSIAIDAGGNFVVAWHSYGQGGADYDIYAQRYGSDGNPQGSEFRVNTYTTDNQLYPSVAMDANGDFVVVWQSNGQAGGPNYDIYAQRYGSDGSPQGSEFQVNTYTTSHQLDPSVAMDSDGNFVVAWHSYNQAGGPNYDIYAQRYGSGGSTQGSEFRVNTYTTNHQEDASVAMDANGNFVVAWESLNQAGGASNDDIYAQRYGSDGSPQGSEFRVNTYTTNFQEDASVAMDAGGDFVVAWHSTGQDGDDDGTSYYEENVYAQRYDSAGVAQGTEFRVNTYTESDQLSPAVAARDAAGDFVVAWESYNQAGGASGADIYAQRYGAPLLSLTKQAAPNTSLPGQTLTYTLVISNTGPVTATAAVISDTLPAGVAFVGPVRLDPPGIDLPSPTLPTLAEGLTITPYRQITLTFPVTLDLSLAGSNLANTAALTSQETTAWVTGTVVITVKGENIYLPLIFKD